MTALTGKIALLAVLGGLALLAGFMLGGWDYNVGGSFLVGLALIIFATLILIPRVAKGEEKGFLQFLLFAFSLKAVATLYRMYWAFVVKTGGDAAEYNLAARSVAEALWRLDFGPLLHLLQRGTSFVEGVTGVVYAFIGPTLYGGFLFFSFLSFLGSCLYYKAFRLAFPAGNRAIYAGLIFLYPSWLYWPSSIGKDALMALLVGIFGYGTALLLRTNRMQSLVLIAVGLWGAYMIRPHVAALLAVPLGIALILRPYRLGIMSPIVRVLMVGGVVTAGWVIIGEANAYVGSAELSLAAGLEQYEEIQGRARGGSFFEPNSVTEPLGILMAVITTFFRPFPWEAHRGAALMLSLEGVFLAGLVIWRFRSIINAIFSARSDPFIIFILAYTLLFIAVFSVVGNFSILGRQRLQMLPFFFMLLAYPNGSESKRNAVAPVEKGAP